MSSESIRSRIPPNPGSQAPASLTPASRFAALSSRSPHSDPRGDERDQREHERPAERGHEGRHEPHEPDGGAQDVADHALARLVRRQAGRERRPPEPSPDDEGPHVGERAADGEREDERDPGVAMLHAERDAVRQHHADQHDADGRHPEVADRPPGVRADHRPGGPDEHEPADEPVRGPDPADRDRRDDHDVRDGHGDPVVDRQLEQAAPLDKRERAEDPEQYGETRDACPRGRQEHEREGRVRAGPRQRRPRRQPGRLVAVQERVDARTRETQRGARDEHERRGIERRHAVPTGAVGSRRRSARGASGRSRAAAGDRTRPMRGCPPAPG